jgi:hypothetical protein
MANTRYALNKCSAAELLDVMQEAFADVGGSDDGDSNSALAPNPAALKTRMMRLGLQKFWDGENRSEFYDEWVDSEVFDQKPPGKCIFHLVEDVERRATLQLAWLRRFPHVRMECCGCRMCFKCKVVGWHRVTCEQNMADLDGDSKAQHCPECGVPTIRSEGCSEIICICGAYWEWNEYDSDGSGDDERRWYDDSDGNTPHSEESHASSWRHEAWPEENWIPIGKWCETPANGGG